MKNKHFCIGEGETYSSCFGKAIPATMKKCAEYTICCDFWDITVFLYYKITKNGWLQLASISEESGISSDSYHKHFYEEVNIESQYRYNFSKKLNENLENALEKRIFSRLPFESFPENFRSEIITESRFQQIKQKYLILKNKAAEGSLLEFLETKSLHPQCCNAEKGLWMAICPSGKNHPLLITILPNKEIWGCGYCHKKGHLQDLETWIQAPESS